MVTSVTNNKQYICYSIYSFLSLNFKSHIWKVDILTLNVVIMI